MRLFARTLLVLCGLAGFAANALAEPYSVTITSAPFGRHVYAMGSACEDIAKKFEPNLNITVEEGFGMVYNYKKMEAASPAEKKHMIILGSDVSLWQAQNGVAPYPQKMAQDVKVLCNLFSSVSFYMSRDLGIRSLPDLNGRTIAIGNKSQDLFGTFLWDQINIGYDMGKKMRVQWVGNSAALSSLKDGLVDAAPAGVVSNPVTGEIMGDPTTIEIEASYDQVSWFGCSREALTKVAEETHSPIKIFTIPANSFKGQTEEILTHGTLNLWAASSELPEEVAYEFVSMIIRHVEKFKDYHANGRLLSKDALAYGWTPEQLHPGAYRAFKDAGLMK